MGQTVGENYLGSNCKQYISPAQIRKMKKNMKKVPSIQKKAEKYSLQEEKIVDDRFEKHLKTL